MIKFLSALLFLLTLILFTPTIALAQVNSFVSIVNPIRGADFWEDLNQQPQTVVSHQVDILRKFGVSATWLIRFDALGDQNILGILNNLPNHEKGLFLEITPTWTNEAGIKYHQSDSWHKAGSAFLTGYEREEREKLIDTAFGKFKKVFGFYPQSVGAWWVDSYSLEYMQKKYNIVASLIVADQYSTDDYQIWGQYFGTPYYPSKKNALHPAQTEWDKLPVVVMQWAARDPVNAYGNGVQESTFSVQANDYIDYHDLKTDYFSSLVDIYTKQSFNKFGHVVVGLENSYFWDKYGPEYERQIQALVDKKNTGQLEIVTMKDFASWYQKTFPKVSPEHITLADDLLGTGKKVVWFMNPYYRAGWFYNQEGSVFRDIRQYVEGEEELCFQKRCDQVNFATSAIRVLDEVSFGHKMILDQGKISDFKMEKFGENYVISYKNEAGRERLIEFMPRDISIDGKVSSIDGLILEATKDQLETRKQMELEQGPFKWSILSALIKTFLFLAFLILGCLVPGLLLVNRILPKETSELQKYTLSLILGFSLITLMFYILAIVNLKQIIFIYLAVNLFILIKFLPWQKFVKSINLNFARDKFNLSILGLIILGTIFQNIPTFKNGLNFSYGLGFWGPNTHDGIWHVSLINQLVKSVPPQNPIFAEDTLKNYHYFYDLLVAVTHYISGIPILDLLFRFYPIIFSLLLGIGSYYIIKSLTKQKLAQFFGLYLVYFAGSFGWIVEYIKFKHLGGESAFWANQSISFNLNPPFAISLLLVITIFQLLPSIKFRWVTMSVFTVLVGSLLAFKAYAGILVLATLLIVGIFKKSFSYLIIFLTSGLLSAILLLSNFSLGKQLIIFSPFWFIHSMIDSPDRVGWVRLSLARTTGWEMGNWFKFLTAETISFFIFLIGNLGTRAFALLALLKIKHIVRRTDYLFLLVFSTLAFIIPVLFIQAGNPWNTIQFIYYFLYISAVIGAVIFAKIVTKLNKIFAVLATFIFIVITPINSWATANGYLSYQPHALVTKSELQALQFLATQEDGIVLTYPFDDKLRQRLGEPWPLLIYDSTAYVSALSKKQAFIEDEPQNQILLTDYKKRLVAAKDFFSGRDVVWSNNFLNSNNIGYIYLPKIYNTSLDNQNLSIRQIFENDEVRIYSVIN